MTGTISTSWSLVKASARVLQQDTELVIFPLLSGVATILVAATFVLPIVMTGRTDLLAEGAIGYEAYVFGFLFYLVQYTVVFFFNSALVGAALIRMEGGDPTVSDGLSVAVDRFPAILGYAALSATVGMVLRFVAERVGILGRLGIGLVGVGWTVATYLAVPVLVSRDVGPLDAVRESAALFKRTWGEQMTASVGMGGAFMVMALAWTALLALLLGGVARFGGGAELAFPLVGMGVMGYVILGLVGSALQGVYTAALFRHASGGQVDGFDTRALRGAFKAPKGFGRGF